MDFSLNNEQQMIIDTLKSFVEQELYPYEAEVEKTNAIRPELAQQIKQKALDLGLYAETDGVPFTISSNLVYALNQALKECTPTRFEKTAILSKYIRKEISKAGFELVGNTDQVSPAVITINLPDGLDSREVGSQLKKNGYLLSYESRYLQLRNWIQICLMGEPTQREIQPLVGLLKATIQQEN